MDLEPTVYKSRQQGAYRFDPWSAEVATMNHAAINLAKMIDGLGSLIAAGFNGIGRLGQALWKAAPIEIEPVKVARPVQLAETASANDRAAA